MATGGKATMLEKISSKLLRPITDTADDLGTRFELEFQRLAYNITSEVDVVVNEALELSLLIKIVLIILSVLLLVLIVRFVAFGARCALFKTCSWQYESEAPQVVLVLPNASEHHHVKEGLQGLMMDDQKRQLLDAIREHSFVVLRHPGHPSSPV